MLVLETKILVVEDEAAIADMIEIILRKEGFKHVTVCGSMACALQQPLADFYMLDVMLPDGTGLAIAETLRTKTDAPIFFLSAKVSDADKLKGFMSGADDYITKPFNPLELVARVKVHLARYHKQSVSKNNYVFSNFTFNVDAAELTVNGHTEMLSGRLFYLLQYLCEHAGQVLSKEQIYNHVWGDPIYDDNTIMVHIRKLREKIEAMPSKPKVIITVRGIGYKLVGER